MTHLRKTHGGKELRGEETTQLQGQKGVGKEKCKYAQDKTLSSGTESHKESNSLCYWMHPAGYIDQYKAQQTGPKQHHKKQHSIHYNQHMQCSKDNICNVAKNNIAIIISKSKEATLLAPTSNWKARTTSETRQSDGTA